MFRFKKIRDQFAVPVTIILIVVVLSFSIFDIINAKNALEDQLKETAYELIRIGESSMGNSLWQLNKREIEITAITLLDNPNVGEVIIWDNVGNELFSQYKEDAEYDIAYLNDFEAIIYYNNEPIGKILISVSNYKVKQMIRRVILMNLLQTIIIITFLVIAIYFISKKIASSIEKLSQFSAKVAQGDLSNRLEIVSQNEIGQLANQFNSMVDNLYTLVSKLGETTELMASSSQEMAASVDDGNERITQVVKCAEEIAYDTSKQFDEIKTVNALIEEMCTILLSVQGVINESAELSQKSHLLANSGGEAVKITIENVHKINEITSRAEDTVKGLTSKSNDIVNFVDLISQIADQTKLLSLNAAIEAARAGESGKGFAVVAAEVQKLADQSDGTAKKISSSIAEMRSAIENTVSIMKQIPNVVNEGKSVAAKAGSALSDIVNATQKTALAISNASADMKKQINNSTEIVDRIHNVYDISKETRMKMERTSKDISVQGQFIGEISSASMDLARTAEDLLHEVSKFNL